MDIEKAIEAAARALCRHDGHAERIAFEGKPMWMSYKVAARAAIESALPYLLTTGSPKGLPDRR